MLRVVGGGANRDAIPACACGGLVEAIWLCCFCCVGANQEDGSVGAANREAIEPGEGESDTNGIGTTGIGTTDGTTTPPVGDPPNHEVMAMVAVLEEDSADWAEEAAGSRTVEGEVRSPHGDVAVAVAVAGFGVKSLKFFVDVPPFSPSMLLSVSRTSLVTSRSERAVIESILGHPWNDSFRRRLWLQVAAIEERTLLVSLGQFSRTSASSRQCPLRGL